MSIRIMQFILFFGGIVLPVLAAVSIGVDWAQIEQALFEWNMILAQFMPL